MVSLIKAKCMHALFRQKIHVIPHTFNNSVMKFPTTMWTNKYFECEWLDGAYVGLLYSLLKSWLKVRTVKGRAREVTMLLLGMTNVRKRHILTVVLSLFVLPYCSSVTYLALNYTVRTFLTFLTMHRVGTQPCQLCLPHETSIPDTALV